MRESEIRNSRNQIWATVSDVQDVLLVLRNNVWKSDSSIKIHKSIALSNQNRWMEAKNSKRWFFSLWGNISPKNWRRLKLKCFVINTYMFGYMNILYSVVSQMQANNSGKMKNMHSMTSSYKQKFFQLAQ